MQIAFQDTAGRTALHWACAVGSGACADLLLTANRSTAFVEAHDGNTPLHTAVLGDHTGVAQAILHSLSSNQRKRLLATINADGLSPVQLAEQRSSRSRHTTTSSDGRTILQCLVPWRGDRNSASPPTATGEGSWCLDLDPSSCARAGTSDTTAHPCRKRTSDNANLDETGGMCNIEGQRPRETARAKKNRQMRESRKMQAEDDTHSIHQVAALEAISRRLKETLAIVRKEAATLRNGSSNGSTLPHIVF